MMKNSKCNYFNWISMIIVFTSSFCKVLPDKSFSNNYESHNIDEPTAAVTTLSLTNRAAQHDVHSAKLRKSRQLEGGEQHEKCRLFVEGEPGKNELYSPDYPNDYPKNINCTRIITAPKGQLIRLDFRNSFHIEAKEECKFDFLEIRDGQYGFSNLIGKFCGLDFPPEITSRERYLWLHFHSDESIEYSGFTAVYEFIDRSREAPSTDLNCTIEKDGYEGFINSSDVPYDIRETVIRNKVPLDCMWRIQVQDKWKIQVKFIDFKLSKPNDCETNFLDIFPEETVMPLRVKNFCGSAGEGITSDSNILHMRFFAEQTAINSTFAILYTAFRDRGSAACTDEEYDCEDATCISKELQCNGRDNCKFRWDEEGCTTESAGQSEHVVIIIVVFGLILGGMVTTFVVNCIRKIMRDQKIIREHIRQSKESKLDEMGRNSKARSKDNTAIDMSLRQKHSEESLVMLDEVSYREVAPTAVSSELRKDGYREKEHSILRHHHDVNLQTSLCSGDDSSIATANEGSAAGAHGVQCANACDMGCQTRESLFASPVLEQTKNVGDGGADAKCLSTFCYDLHGRAIPPAHSQDADQLFRRGVNIHPHAMHHIGFAPRPQDCHLHHKHQPYLLQLKANAQQLNQPHYQQQPLQTSTVTVPMTAPVAPAEQLVTNSSKVKRKASAVTGSREPVDVTRNSAPDVIIMTSN